MNYDRDQRGSCVGTLLSYGETVKANDKRYYTGDTHRTQSRTDTELSDTVARVAPGTLSPLRI